MWYVARGGLLAGIIVFLVLVLTSLGVLAADIKPLRYSCFVRVADCDKQKSSILIDGLIENGDADKFISVLKLMPYSPLDVILRSPGGSIPDALTIGRLVRQLLIPTLAPEQYDNGVTHSETRTYRRSNSCYCASACVLIWAADVHRNIAYVLLHRPYLDLSVNAKLSLEKSQEADTLLRNQVIEYLKEVDVPEKYATDMLSTSSNQAISRIGRRMVDGEM